jgi:hypothetical protein
MQSYYEINISHNGIHFLATADRSIQTQAKARKVYAILKQKFPVSEGYTIDVTFWETTGCKVDFGIMEGQAREFYRDLCETVYGNADKNCQGVMSVEMIAVRMGLSTETTQKYCDAMISYGITEKQGGGYVV